MRTEDDDVDVFRLRCIQDGVGRIAFPDHEGCSRAGGECTTDEELKAGLDPRPLLIDSPQEQASRQGQSPWVDDTEDDELATRLDREEDRLLRGSVGRGGQVRREKDAADPRNGFCRRTIAAWAISCRSETSGRPVVSLAIGTRFHARDDRVLVRPGPVTSGPFPRATQPRTAAAGPLLSSSSMVDAAMDSQRTAGEIQAALEAAVRGVAGLVSVDEVLQIIVDRVRPLVGAQYAALGTVDSAGRIERFITSGMDNETRRRIGPLPEGHGLLGLIIRENRSFRIPDMNTDPRRYGFPPNHPPMTSFLGVPIIVKGISLGRLYLTNKTGAGEFSQEDQSLVETFALHAGIAMDNARLHDQLQRLAVVDERERISKDLHDGIIQNMYAVSLSLEEVPELMEEDRIEAAARVERAIDSIHLAIQDIRNFIFGLRPELLEGASLVAGLATLVEEYRHNTMIDLELRLPDVATEPPAEVTGQLLGIVSESISNVLRHSRASRAVIELIADENGRIQELRIEDNGIGFDPARVGKLGHQGLANTRERASQIGGSITIDSQPGKGTRLIILVPGA